MKMEEKRANNSSGEKIYIYIFWRSCNYCIFPGDERIYLERVHSFPRELASLHFPFPARCRSVPFGDEVLPWHFAAAGIYNGNLAWQVLINIAELISHNYTGAL